MTDGLFSFSINDVVLAEWDKKLYYAKILSISQGRSSCRLLFDDNSEEDVAFSLIHSVNETTAEIVCVVCKEDFSTTSCNEIVLCDSCSVGFHQQCHNPEIPAKALEYYTPWVCSFCKDGTKNPYIANNPFEESKDTGSRLKQQEYRENNKQNSTGMVLEQRHHNQNEVHHTEGQPKDNFEKSAQPKKLMETVAGIEQQPKARKFQNDHNERSWFESRNKYNSFRNNETRESFRPQDESTRPSTHQRDNWRRDGHQNYGKRNSIDSIRPFQSRNDSRPQNYRYRDGRPNSSREFNERSERVSKDRNQNSINGRHDNQEDRWLDQKKLNEDKSHSDAKDVAGSREAEARNDSLKSPVKPSSGRIPKLPHKDNLREKMAKRYMPIKYGSTSMNRPVNHVRDGSTGHSNNLRQSSENSKQSSDSEKKQREMLDYRGKPDNSKLPTTSVSNGNDSKVHSTIVKPFVNNGNRSKVPTTNSKPSVHNGNNSKVQTTMSKPLVNNGATDKTLKMEEISTKNFKKLELVENGSRNLDDCKSISKETADSQRTDSSNSNRNNSHKSTDHACSSKTVQNDDTDVGSAFRFLKEGMRNRPRSLTERRTELSVNYKNADDDYGASPIHCKHSDIYDDSGMMGAKSKIGSGEEEDNVAHRTDFIFDEVFEDVKTPVLKKKPTSNNSYIDVEDENGMESDTYPTFDEDLFDDDGLVIEEKTDDEICLRKGKFVRVMETFEVLESSLSRTNSDEISNAERSKDDHVEVMEENRTNEDSNAGSTALNKNDGIDNHNTSKGIEDKLLNSENSRADYMDSKKRKRSHFGDFKSNCVKEDLDDNEPVLDQKRMKYNSMSGTGSSLSQEDKLQSMDISTNILNDACRLSQSLDYQKRPDSRKASLSSIDYSPKSLPTRPSRLELQDSQSLVEVTLTDNQSDNHPAHSYRNKTETDSKCDLIVEGGGDGGSLFGIRIGEVFSLKGGLSVATENPDAASLDKVENIVGSLKDEKFEVTSHHERRQSATLSQDNKEKANKLADIYESEKGTESCLVDFVIPVYNISSADELKTLSSSNERSSPLSQNLLTSEKCDSTLTKQRKSMHEKMGDEARAKMPRHRTHSESSDNEPSDQQKPKRRNSKATNSPMSDKTFDRISLDLPRHNWLLERLVSENKLESDTLCEELVADGHHNRPKKIKKRKRNSKNEKIEGKESESSDGDTACNITEVVLRSGKEEGMEITNKGSKEEECNRDDIQTRQSEKNDSRSKNDRYKSPVSPGDLKLCKTQMKDKLLKIGEKIRGANSNLSEENKTEAFNSLKPSMKTLTGGAILQTQGNQRPKSESDIPKQSANGLTNEIPRPRSLGHCKDNLVLDGSKTLSLKVSIPTSRLSPHSKYSPVFRTDAKFGEFLADKERSKIFTKQEEERTSSSHQGEIKKEKGIEYLNCTPDISMGCDDKDLRINLLEGQEIRDIKSVAKVEHFVENKYANIETRDTKDIKFEGKSNDETGSDITGKNKQTSAMVEKVQESELMDKVNDTKADDKDNKRDEINSERRPSSCRNFTDVPPRLRRHSVSAIEEIRHDLTPNKSSEIMEIFKLDLQSAEEKLLDTLNVRSSQNSVQKLHVEDQISRVQIRHDKALRINSGGEDVVAISSGQQVHSFHKHKTTANKMENELPLPSLTPSKINQMNTVHLEKRAVPSMDLTAWSVTTKMNSPSSSQITSSVVATKTVTSVSTYPPTAKTSLQPIPSVMPYRPSSVASTQLNKTQHKPETSLSVRCITEKPCMAARPIAPNQSDLRSPVGMPLRPPAPPMATKTVHYHLHDHHIHTPCLHHPVVGGVDPQHQNLASLPDTHVRYAAEVDPTVDGLRHVWAMPQPATKGVVEPLQAAVPQQESGVIYHDFKSQQEVTLKAMPMQDNALKSPTFNKATGLPQERKIAPYPTNVESLAISQEQNGANTYHLPTERGKIVNRQAMTNTNAKEGLAIVQRRQTVEEYIQVSQSLRPVTATRRESYHSRINEREVETTERPSEKPSLEEKADVILRIIEDDSISEQTKKELLKYWRSSKTKSSPGAAADSTEGPNKKIARIESDQRGNSNMQHENRPPPPYPLSANNQSVHQTMKQRSPSDSGGCNSGLNYHSSGELVHALRHNDVSRVPYKTPSPHNSPKQMMQNIVQQQQQEQQRQQQQHQLQQDQEQHQREQRLLQRHFVNIPGNHVPTKSPPANEMHQVIAQYQKGPPNLLLDMAMPDRNYLESRRVAATNQKMPPVLTPVPTSDNRIPRLPDGPLALDKTRQEYLGFVNPGKINQSKSPPQLAHKSKGITPEDAARRYDFQSSYPDLPIPGSTTHSRASITQRNEERVFPYDSRQDEGIRQTSRSSIPVRSANEREQTRQAILLQSSQQQMQEISAQELAMICQNKMIKQHELQQKRQQNQPLGHLQEVVMQSRQQEESRAYQQKFQEDLRIRQMQQKQMLLTQQRQKIQQIEEAQLQQQQQIHLQQQQQQQILQQREKEILHQQEQQRQQELLNFQRQQQQQQFKQQQQIQKQKQQEHAILHQQQQFQGFPTQLQPQLHPQPQPPILSLQGALQPQQQEMRLQSQAQQRSSSRPQSETDFQKRQGIMANHSPRPKVGEDRLRRPMQEPKCELCGSTAKFLCSRCRGAWYCSEGCQIKQWHDHGKHCTAKGSK